MEKNHKSEKKIEIERKLCEIQQNALYSLTKTTVEKDEKDWLIYPVNDVLSHGKVVPLENVEVPLSDIHSALVFIDSASAVQKIPKLFPIDDLPQKEKEKFLDRICKEEALYYRIQVSDGTVLAQLSKIRTENISPRFLSSDRNRITASFRISEKFYADFRFTLKKYDKFCSEFKILTEKFNLSRPKKLLEILSLIEESPLKKFLVGFGEIQLVNAGLWQNFRFVRSNPALSIKNLEKKMKDFQSLVDASVEDLPKI